MTLGLSDEQFYSLTPRQYSLLLQRHLDRERHTEHLAGVVAAAVANWSMGAPKEPMRPRDFALPLLREMPAAGARRPRLNRKAIAADIRAQFDAAMRRQPK